MTYAPGILGSGAPIISSRLHANPPEETFKHFEGACNTQMTGGIGVACVHDPRSDQQRYVDANRVIERRPSKTGRGTI